MKYILSFYCIILIFNSVKGQNEVIASDSLSKYSYTLCGIIDKSAIIDFGTCFFYKKKDELFLITAKHVLYECDSLTNAYIPKYKVAIVYVGGQMSFFQFTIPAYYGSCIADFIDPDLFAMKIDKKLAHGVNTIEAFIASPIANYGKIQIFGQGFNRDSISLNFEKAHKIELKERSFTFYTSCPTPDSNFVDTIHHFVETHQLEVGRWMKGFSGSPVFLEDLSKKSWRFCGVFVQSILRVSEKLPGGLVLVNPQYVKEVIDSVK